jgi:hypothetical protein
MDRTEAVQSALSLISRDYLCSKAPIYRGGGGSPLGDPVTLHNVDSVATVHLALLTAALKPVQTANYTGLPYLQKHQHTNQLP